MGNRLHYLRQAVSELQQTSGMTLSAISSIYETEPIGYTEQSSFLNMVVQGNTTLTARELLNKILEVEKKLGRTREIRWGPRTIDVDILIYGTELISEEDLEIPHPRMNERAFVLIPLAEITGDCPIPIGNGIYTTPLELLAKVEDKSGVNRWMDFDWETEYEHFES